LREHRVPALAVARRRFERITEEVDVVVHDRGTGVEARQRRLADLVREARRVGVAAVDRRLDDDRPILHRVVGHDFAEGRTT